ITKIELKQRINVLLVPNKSLDTPNYKLERLKHDDPRLDNLDSSYKLAEEVDDVASFTRRSQERTNKQEPVIKGVLPDGPAPVAPPKPETPAVAAATPVPTPVPAAVPSDKGFFGWLKSLFGGATAPAPVTPAPVAQETVKSERADGGKGSREGRGRGGRGGERREGDRPPRGERRGDARGERSETQGRSGNESRRGDNRGERTEGQQGRSGQRRDNRRDNRPENAPSDGTQVSAANLSAPAAAETPETKDEGGRRERRGGRGDNRRRQGSEERDLSQSMPATETTTVSMEGGSASETAAATEIPGEEASRAPRERRSRDRYGRDRRERAPREEETTEATVPAATADAADDERPTRSYFTMPVESNPEAEVPTPQTPPTADVEPVPVLSAPTSTAPESTPKEHGTPHARRGLPLVQPYTVSIEELTGIAQGSGLEWINSDESKVAAAQAAIAAEPKPIHVPREPRPVMVVDEGPLVLVETRKDLREVVLPFENR
ncbi:MAG: ribonuclease E/G, partial [Hydrogenophaga sp.]|nr:ribonuclease E/G [Hydrogenophaga sp.]